MAGKYENKKVIAEKKEKAQLKEDNLLLGQQISDLEIAGMEQGIHVSDMEIKIIELEGKLA